MMFDQALRSEINRLAGKYGIETASLFAVVEVESGGKLFARIKGNEEPLIRFEGHYFYRLLPLAKRNKAVVKGLASPRAGKVGNPYLQSSRWKMLKRAEKIDRPAALASCSWGCGQVMGAHWRWLGYASIDALVVEARSGAAGQVRLMMRFIRKAKLLDKLANHDWAGFARAYNGPAYKRLGYDRKFARAYAKYSNTAAERPSGRHDMVFLRMGSRGDAVRTLQQELSSLGYFLVVDGDFGPATERMVKQFQRETRLKVDGIFGPKSFASLSRKLLAGD